METAEEKSSGEDKEPRLEWVEHLGKAFDAFFKDIKELVPQDTYDHLRSSRKEFLLAIRSVIDRRIEKLEKEGPKKAHRVEVQ